MVTSKTFRYILPNSNSFWLWLTQRLCIFNPRGAKLDVGVQTAPFLNCCPCWKFENHGWLKNVHQNTVDNA